MTAFQASEFSGDESLFSLGFAVASDFESMATVWKSGCERHEFGWQGGHELFFPCVGGIELS